MPSNEHFPWLEIGIAALLAFTCGFFTADILLKSGHNGAKAVIQEAAKEVHDSQQKSVELHAKVEEGNQKADDVARRAKERMNAVKPVVKIVYVAKDVNEPSLQTNECEVADGTYNSIYLDSGTVGLLNEVRGYGQANSGPSSGSDDQSTTSSKTSISDLVQADIDAAKRYNELMKRHNTLVDYVQSKVDQQAKPSE